jgi:hypothetical protein
VCIAAALLESELPLELVERHGLTRRVHVRGSQREARFDYRDPPLPVWFEGRLQVPRWGGRRRGGKRRLGDGSGVADRGSIAAKVLDRRWAGPMTTVVEARRRVGRARSAAVRGPSYCTLTSSLFPFHCPSS